MREQTARGLDWGTPLLPTRLRQGVGRSWKRGLRWVGTMPQGTPRLQPATMTRESVQGGPSPINVDRPVRPRHYGEVPCGEPTRAWKTQDREHQPSAGQNFACHRQSFVPSDSGSSPEALITLRIARRIVRISSLSRCPAKRSSISSRNIGRVRSSASLPSSVMSA